MRIALPGRSRKTIKRSQLKRRRRAVVAAPLALLRQVHLREAAVVVAEWAVVLVDHVRSILTAVKQPVRWVGGSSHAKRLCQAIQLNSSRRSPSLIRMVTRRPAPQQKSLRFRATL